MWNYEEEPVNGGAGGEVFRSIFIGSGLEPASRLAREAIQNSVDAARPGETPQVTLRMNTYSGEDLARIWKAAGLDQLARRAEALGLHEDNALKARPDALRVLQAIDTGTTGLSGDPTSPSSKLRKLLMEIGGSQKISEDVSSGGSYGFGKAVYSASSRIAVIFAYSRTTNETGEPLSLFMGCAYHKSHEFEGERTSGRGFFGVPVEVRHAVRYDAFTGDEADRRAADLDMARAEGDLGTTIAIFDCPLNMEDVKRGVERSWWPKLTIDKSFKVRLIDEMGRKLHPRPMQDAEIRPFVEAINVALGRSPEQKGKSRLFKNFRHLGNGLKVGQLGLFVMSDEEIDEEADRSDLRDTIALVRSPGMVVEHYGKRQVNHPPVAGVFIADSDLDDILRRSEPPEHDRWDSNSDRLDAAKGEKDVVEEVHKRIWRELRTFQRNARPPEPPSSNRFTQLERELAHLFGPTGKREPVGGGKGETPISMVPRVRIEPVGEGLQVVGHVTLRLKEEHANTLPVLVSLELSSVDELQRRIDPIPLSVEFGETAASPRGDGTWALTLEPGAKLDVAVKSDVYDKDWTVEFVPQVRPVTEEVAP